MTDFTDVEVRIFGAAADAADPDLRKVEVRVNQSGCWGGQSKFDLAALDPDDAAYGEALGNQLANPGLVRALDQAGLTRGNDIRLRFWIDSDPTAPHLIRWERVSFTISGASWRIATHPHIALSRYIPVEQPDGSPPDSVFFRLLVAVANPTGLNPEQVIDVEREIASFVNEFEAGSQDQRLQVAVQPGRTGLSAPLQARIAKLGWNLVSGNASLQNLSDELHKKYHGLHLLAHGEYNPRTGVPTLLLESDTGSMAEVHDSDIQSWITNELQLIVFQACLSGASPAENRLPFTSLAPRLVRSGLPAAIAMQDFVRMDDARVFFSEFYRSLLDQGMVDVAVNRGRQRVMATGVRDSWSIPALISRLRGGRLWQTDAIRQAVLNALDNLAAPGSDKWPELQAIEHTRGIANYDPLQGASGPCFDLWTQMQTLASQPGKFLVLTGAAGSSKGSQIARLFRRAAEDFRDARSSIHPIFLSISDLTGRAPDTWPVIERVWSGQARNSDFERVANRRFLFLIDAERELNGPLRETALSAVERLKALPGSSVIMVADEVLLPALRDVGSAKLLVVQPLDFPRIRAYLVELKSDAATKLLEELRTRGYWDLASQPRFLEHMLDLIESGTRLRSRRAILESLANSYVSRIDTHRVPRVCVDAAAREIAWGIQHGRSGDIEGAPYYECLNAARAGREFPLAEIKHALMEEAGVLTPSGGEGVRFVYTLLQAYFAAAYLAAAPDRVRWLDEITASLGRLSRLRRWEKVLVLLATMLPSPADFLRTILAGSSLMEGEQLFLAARCYQEAIAERSHSKSMDAVVDQMVDSLIWRCSWDMRRPYADRRKALEHLIELAVVSKRPSNESIRHLVALAFDPVPNGKSDSLPNVYDWAGIRLTAATGLTRLGAQTLEYVEANRPELTEVLSAWARLPADAEPMKLILKRDDPSFSVIAAFAFTNSHEGGEALLNAYAQSKNRDVKWGITDALSAEDPGWVQTHVLEPWMAATELAQHPEILKDANVALRAAHICYLLQKIRLAEETDRKFLGDCLQTGSASLQGRALRAFGKLQDAEIEGWLRPLCEHILSREPEQIDSSKIRLAAGDLAHEDLQRSALEVLRDIGDEGSIEAVRGTRAQSSDNELRQLSFQVAEEIYWRLSGGIDRESADAAAFQTTKEESS